MESKIELVCHLDVDPDYASEVVAEYGGDLPNVDDKRVYMLDFSVPREQCRQIAARAKDFLILDHHKTAEADLEGLPFAQFDMKRSGAGMTWDHFFPEDKRPWLVDYVEDRDLWRHRMRDSKEINAWVSTAQQTFEDWDAMCADGTKKALVAGKAVKTFI